MEKTLRAYCPQKSGRAAVFTDTGHWSGLLKNMNGPPQTDWAGRSKQQGHAVTEQTIGVTAGSTV